MDSYSLAQLWRMVYNAMEVKHIYPSVAVRLVDGGVPPAVIIRVTLALFVVSTGLIYLSHAYIFT